MDRSTPIYTKQGVSPDTSGVQVVQASNIMERDKGQSDRLHEPTSISSHTDPITGKDVMGTAGHPFVVDGILTAYFESDETRGIYLKTPFNHPALRLRSKSSSEDDRGG